MAKINFTVHKLEKPLKEHKVTATIRGRNYITENAIKEGKKVGIYFRGEFVGTGMITEIRNISWRELSKPKIIKMEGFSTSEELKNALKRVGWRFHLKRLKKGKLSLPLIKFRWLEGRCGSNFSV